MITGDRVFFFPGYSGSVHTISLNQFLENGVFTLKASQMFSIQTTLKELKIATIIVHFRFIVEENICREITVIITGMTSPVSKSTVFKMFSIYTEEPGRLVFSDSSGVKNVFEMVPCHEGLA